MMKDLIDYYNNECDEEKRLTRGKSNQVEYLTTIRYFNKYFSQNLKVLDTCAGTGRYAFYLANQGHSVTAGDIVPKNVNVIKSKQEENRLLDHIYCGSILNLSEISSETFDVVLCMGALYHLQSEMERIQAIQECSRVLKNNGLIVVAYTSKYATGIDILNDDLSNIDILTNMNNTGNVHVFHTSTIEEIEQLMEMSKFRKLCITATDGLSFTIKNKLNNSSDEAFSKWLEYFWGICEDTSLLGYSLHGLYIGRKKAQESPSMAKNA